MNSLLFWALVVYAVGDGLSKDPYKCVAQFLALLYTIVVFFFCMILGGIFSADFDGTWQHDKLGPLINQVLCGKPEFPSYESCQDGFFYWWNFARTRETWWGFLLAAMTWPFALIAATVKVVFYLPFKAGTWPIYITYTIGLLISLRVWIGMYGTMKYYRRARAWERDQLDMFYNPLRRLRRGRWN